MKLFHKSCQVAKFFEGKQIDSEDYCDCNCWSIKWGVLESLWRHKLVYCVVIVYFLPAWQQPKFATHWAHESKILILSSRKFHVLKIEKLEMAPWDFPLL